MSIAVTDSRRHDAEWLLHRERMANDLQLAAARRKLARKKPTAAFRSERTIVTPQPLTPDIEAAAVDTLHRVADRAGLDEDARVELLEALGLTEPDAAPETPTAAACRHCGSEPVTVRKDGLVAAHSPAGGAPAGRWPCPETNNPPRTETAR
jgi:hypothetical protein